MPVAPGIQTIGRCESINSINSIDREEFNWKNSSHNTLSERAGHGTMFKNIAPTMQIPERPHSFIEHGKRWFTRLSLSTPKEHAFVISTEIFTSTS